LAQWQREQAGEPRWTWAKDPLARMPTILGNARLEGDALIVETSSRARDGAEARGAAGRPRHPRRRGAHELRGSRARPARRRSPGSRTRTTGARSTSPCRYSAIARRANG
jgi:hypothetical protein